MWTQIRLLIGAVWSGSTLFASVLNLSVMLGNYFSRRLQQTTFSDAFFFLGALRVNATRENKVFDFTVPQPKRIFIFVISWTVLFQLHLITTKQNPWDLVFSLFFHFCIMTCVYINPIKICHMRQEWIFYRNIMIIQWFIYNFWSYGSWDSLFTISMSPTAS